MKKILMILALMAVTMTAGAWNLKVVDSDKMKGSVTFEVGGTAVTTADEGKTVTIKVTPNDGFVVKTIGAKAYTSGGMGRSAGVDVLDDIALTKTKENIYTFTMPRASVKVSVTLEIKIVIPAEESSAAGGEAKIMDNVKLGMSMIEGAEETKPDGTKVIPVVVSGVDFSATVSSSELKEITLEIGNTQKVGNTEFVVKKIAKGAFETAEGSDKVVSKVVLKGDKVLEIEEGAMKTKSKGLLDIETELALLDDYAVVIALKENFEAIKISAIAKAPNLFWTFSCGVDVQVPDGVTVNGAYNREGAIRVLPIDEVNSSKIIKANNGVIMACKSGKGGGTYRMVASPTGPKSGEKLAETKTDANSYADNCMAPNTQAANYATNEILILKDNEFHTIASSTTDKVPACKAVYSYFK